MSETNTCACSVAPKLIFPCSGGSDVGAITDQTARILTRDGVGKMYCLAGIGGRVSNIIETTQAADMVLAIDGCPQDCARKTLEQAGFTGFLHLRLSDIGLNKGESPLTNAYLAQAAARAQELLADRSNERNHTKYK
jgi:uncharacterized metal-binding protein